MSKQQQQNPKSVRPSDRSFLKYATMGTQMLVIMVTFTFGGYKLDHYLQYKVPVFTVSFSLLGIFVALYLTLKDLLRNERKK